MGKMKPVWWIVLTMVLCLAVGVCVHVYDENANGDRVLFDEASGRILSEYPEEIRFLEEYTGEEIDEIDAGTVHIIRQAILALELDGDTPAQLRFDDLQYDMVDAILEYRAYRENSGILSKG